MPIIRELFLFLRRICTHWGALVTGGFVIGVLGIYQGVGHPLSPWVYWTIAGIAGLGASFLTWREEEKKVQALKARIEELEQLTQSQPVQNIFLPPPAPPPQPLKHNVNCLGITIQDSAVTICFQNVPIAGEPIGDFRDARLSIEYRLEATGKEWVTIFPARWISDNQDDISIGVVPQCAFLAAYYELDDHKWKALLALGTARSEFSWKDRVDGITLPPGRFLIKATLIGENNLSLPPIEGILALGQKGDASFSRLSTPE